MNTEFYDVVEGDRQMCWGSYFAQEMRGAVGPWHARFLFCGQWGHRPDEVKVVQSNRGDYWCSVGEFPGSIFMGCE